MAEQGFEGGDAVPEREMTPDERAAMEFATRNLDEDIRALLASRPRTWTPPAQAAMAEGSPA